MDKKDKEIVTRDEFQAHLADDKRLADMVISMNEKLDRMLLWSENLKFSWRALLGLLGFIALIIGLITGITKLFK